MLKIAVCCIFACSLSHQGKTSDGEHAEDLSPRPSSVTPLDLDLAQCALDQASSSSTALTDPSITTEEPTNTALPKAGKRRTVTRSKSTGSKTKSSGVKKEEEKKLLTTPKLSADMKVEPSSDRARMLANFAFYLAPTIKTAKSPVLFSPNELPSIYILLALRAGEIKGPNDTHSMIYVPPIEMFIGFRGMLYGKESDLKNSLKFNNFLSMKNFENALRLLCITTETDLEKILNQKDMEMAEDLTGETQKELSFETHHLKVIRSDTDKRPDQDTLASLQKEKSLKNTESNLATYVLMTHAGIFIPEPETEGSSSKVKKEKKKSATKEEKNPNGVQFLLSVTRLTKDKEHDSFASPKSSTSKSKKSDPTTPRKRAKSKGANANAASSSVPSPSQSEEVSQNQESESNEKVTELSSQPIEKGE